MAGKESFYLIRWTWLCNHLHCAEVTTGPLGQDYGNGVGAVRGLWSYIDDKGKRRVMHEPTWRMIKDLE
jgi:transketolase